MTKQVPISFEFFPSKTDVGAEKTQSCASRTTV